VWQINKRRESKYVAIVLIIVMNCCIVGKENEEWFVSKIEQPPVGNFALPTSQQPGPLIAFGQNVPEKGVLQAFIYGNQVKAEGISFSEIHPSLLYGITDRFSILVELPIAVKYKGLFATSRGVSDLVIQAEGVAYAREKTTKIEEITGVFHIGFPTGSIHKQPPTGLGSPTFFLGFTASHTDLAWYYFTSMGGVITTMYKNIKFGNQFLYQFGLGRNIGYKTDSWILNWLIELDGIYTQRTTVAGITECNSASNVVLVGPSVWFSSKKFIFQGGISAVVAQHAAFIQPKNKYLVSAYIGYTF